jgi:hypothetical protein
MRPAFSAKELGARKFNLLDAEKVEEQSRGSNVSLSATSMSLVLSAQNFFGCEGGEIRAKKGN